MAATLDDHRLNLDGAAYERLKAYLEQKHRREWVVFHGGMHVKTSKSFEACALWAVDTYGEAPFLIKQVGLEVSPPPILRLPYVVG